MTKRYAVIDQETGEGYITTDPLMARYAHIGSLPKPYQGVRPLAQRVREMSEDGCMARLRLIEIDCD
jgi:hypothetical protein